MSSDHEKVKAECINKVSRLVTNEAGIQLGPKQHQMVSSKISKRIRELEIDDWAMYLKYLEKNIKTEIVVLVSLLTTHHTFFFREYTQFEDLADKLPGLIKNAKAKGRNYISIWSAACSFGQEVYSLAMFLEKHLPLVDPSMDYRILGSDVDVHSVEISKNGVYKWKEVKKIPDHFLKGNWSRGKGSISEYCKVSNKIKSHCDFKTINLNNVGSEIDNEVFDVIFCRNVFIYFNSKQITSVVKKFSQHMHNNSLLYVGLSETLLDTETNLVSLGKSVYSKEVQSNTVEIDTPESSTERPPLRLVKEDIPEEKNINILHKEKIRVLCVDDSKTVHSLLKKIFATSDEFEIVGSAFNGLEAAEFLKNNQCDVVTLDIHMPNQNGIEYLESIKSENHPPVIMLSSVSRENGEFAMRALELGASDYIEKPTLHNFNEVCDEILMKAKYASLSSFAPVLNSCQPQFSNEYSPLVSDTDSKVRVIHCRISDLVKVKYLLNHLKAPQPPTVISLEEHDDLSHSFFDNLEKESSLKCTRNCNDSELLSNRVYFMTHFELKSVSPKIKNRECVSIAFSQSQDTAKSFHVSCQGSIFKILEDNDTTTISNYWTMIVPYTSFIYESEKAFAIKKVA